MTKVLVTGGAGFIGSHIVEKLVDDNYEVVIVDNLGTGLKNNINISAKFYECDITSDKIYHIVEESKPNYIIHQAAQVSVARSIEEIQKDAEINILGSIKLIDAAIKNNVKKIVFASSAAVYGNPVHVPVNTKHPINPLSPYGLSKYTIEKYLRLTKEIYGLDFAILRYSNVYGPRQSSNGEGGVVSIFFNNIINNLPIEIHGDGNQTRDFIYVKDVANANVLALKNGSGKTLNISTGIGVSINELYEEIRTITNKSSKVNYTKKRTGDIDHSILDNSLTKYVLDWKPNYSLKNGLEEYLNSYIKLV